jgi:TRAP-type C4-dicarboxylate transport system substrate-binding protein
MVDFIAADFFGVMNKKKWESLPPDIQKVINEVSGAWAAEFIGKAWDKDQQNVIESLKKKGGHEFITLSLKEQERWRKTLQPVWDEVVKGMETQGVPGRKCLDDILKLRDKYSK